MSNFVRSDRHTVATTSIDDFASAVRLYCGWAENVPKDSTDRSEMRMARRHLSSLYAMAIDLPSSDCEQVERPVSHDDWMVVFKRFGNLPVGYYRSISDPFDVEAGGTTLGDLADDLADIWRDVSAGLALFDAGYRDAAAERWRESFQIHWSTHAADALAIVQCWLRENWSCMEGE